MKNIFIVSILLLTLASAAVAEKSSPTIGKGSIVSKRIALTRIAGRAKTHKTRILAIIAKQQR